MSFKLCNRRVLINDVFRKAAYVPAELVTWKDWGSKLVVDRLKFKLPLKFVVFTLASDTEPCFTREECVQRLHEIQKRDIEDFGLTNIRYNFLLGGDGRIYEGRGWFTKPGIISKFSAIRGKFMHVTCIGDYTDKLRPEAMYKAQWDLVELAVKKGLVTKDFHFL